MRQNYVQAKRIVIKIGSRVLTGGADGLDTPLISRIAADIAGLREAGREIVIVTSGAIAAGREALGLLEKPRTIPQKQAAAAVGQTRLMRAYEDAFAARGITAAQILLTRSDLADRTRFLNARATIETLLEFGAVPIINENDSVVVEEIKFGDNDNLSALVTNLVDAGLLVILTDIAGFYDADPRTDPSARLLPLVKTVTREMERAAGGAGSSVGTGGMATKLSAARKASRSGVATLIVDGTQDGAVARAVAGEEIGTLFLPARKSLPSRKHWIAFTLRPAGTVTVDEGAHRVLAEQGKSLLPSGIIRVEGSFDRGACIRIASPAGTEFARGLVDYSADEIRILAGRKSTDIEELLGYRYGDEIVHRDNLALI